MKKLLLLSFTLLSIKVEAQPAPVVEATTNQIVTGTAGYPFVVTPRGLAGAGILPGTNSGVLPANAPGVLTNSGAGAGWATNVALNSLIATNFFLATNSFAGNVADFSKSLYVTNGGNVSITSVANLTAGCENDLMLVVGAAGADRTVSFPITFHTNLIAGIVTNGNVNRYWLAILPTMYSNVYELPAK